MIIGVQSTKLQSKSRVMEGQMKDSLNPVNIYSKRESYRENYYIKGRTITSVFNFMRRVSIAELVYEVSKTDSPLINNDFTACTIVYVLPVPGIPRIRA